MAVSPGQSPSSRCSREGHVAGRAASRCLGWGGARWVGRQDGDRGVLVGSRWVRAYQQHGGSWWWTPPPSFRIWPYFPFPHRLRASRKNRQPCFRRPRNPAPLAAHLPVHDGRPRMASSARPLATPPHPPGLQHLPLAAQELEGLQLRHPSGLTRGDTRGVAVIVR